MSTDRTGGVDGGVEAVEDWQPRDRPPPPPPPDQPGAEPEGMPSRADTHAAAAAPSKPETSQPAENKPAQPESSTPNESTSESGTPESLDTISDNLSGSVQESSGERDTAVKPSATDERPAARDAEAEPFEGPGSSVAVDNGTELRPSTSATSPVEDMTVRDERPPTQPAATSEAVDIPAPPTAQENADAEEAFPAFDDVGNEAEKLLSRADSHAAAAAANGEVGEKRDDVPEQTEGTPPADVDPDTDVLVSETQQPAHDRQPVAETAEQQSADENRRQEPQDVTDNGPEELRLMIGDKTIREHIDPAGAGIGELPEGHKEPFGYQVRDKDASWADGTDRLGDLPTGEELVEPQPEDDDNSPAERLRKSFFRKSDDYQDSVRKNIAISHDAFQRPPDGHPEIKVCHEDLVPPVFASMPQSGVDIATAAANALIVAAMFGEGIRRIRERHMKSGER